MRHRWNSSSQGPAWARCRPANPLRRETKRPAPTICRNGAPRPTPHRSIAEIPERGAQVAPNWFALSVQRRASRGHTGGDRARIAGPDTLS